MHPKLSQLPTVHGRVVTLRPPALGEVRALAEGLAADPESGPWWGTDPDAIVEWFEDPDYHVLVIEVDGHAAGIIAFEEELDPCYHAAGIDIGLLTGETGRGVGSDALKTLAGWLFDARGHHRLTIDPAVANERAIHVYQKVGFKPIGVARSYERHSDGTLHDNLLMDMLAGELVG